jgi:3-oxoacyl-[acyl-carrier protein] reductase
MHLNQPGRTVANMGRMDGKVALVTGSTKGIGRATAALLAAEGARVIVHGTRQADAEAVAQTIPGAVGIGADMGDRAAVVELIERAVTEVGPIDVLINNAGVAGRRAITRITDEEWDHVIAVNLTGPLVAIRAVVPSMKKRATGVIINLVSVAATEGTVGFSSYASSKAGLTGLTITLGAELAGFNIRVNAVSPSALTSMTRELPPEVLQGMIDNGLPEVESVAEVILFLASDASRDITGQVLRVAGGISGGPS